MNKSAKQKWMKKLNKRLKVYRKELAKLHDEAKQNEIARKAYLNAILNVRRNLHQTNLRIKEEEDV